MCFIQMPQRDRQPFIPGRRSRGSGAMATLSPAPAGGSREGEEVAVQWPPLPPAPAAALVAASPSRPIGRSGGGDGDPLSFEGEAQRSVRLSRPSGTAAAGCGGCKARRGVTRGRAEKIGHKGGGPETRD
jgi:hypothetical protein